MALHLVGLVAGLEWLPITVGLYLIGALLVPAEQGLALQLGAAQDASDVRGSLDRLLGQLRGKVADDLYAKVVSIQGSILATLAAEGDVRRRDRSERLPHPPDRAGLPARGLRHVPAHAPRSWPSDGPSPAAARRTTCCWISLSLMDSRLAEVADDIARHDSDKLLANGRFIAEKFAVSSLRVPSRRGDGSPFRPAIAAPAWPNPWRSRPTAPAERERVH